MRRLGSLPSLFFSSIQARENLCPKDFTEIWELASQVARLSLLTAEGYLDVYAWMMIKSTPYTRLVIYKQTEIEEYTKVKQSRRLPSPP